MKAWKALTAGALALATIAAPPASAAPISGSFAPMAAQASDGSNIVEVRRGYHRGHYHRRRGGGVGVGIGLGIIGGLIAAEALRASPDTYEDGRELCAREFRSLRVGHRHVHDLFGRAAGVPVPVRSL